MNMFETCQYYLGQIIDPNVQNGTYILSQLSAPGAGRLSFGPPKFEETHAIQTNLRHDSTAKIIMLFQKYSLK